MSKNYSAFGFILTIIVSVALFFVFAFAVLDIFNSSEKSRQRDKIAELSTKLFLLERKVSLVVSEQEMLRRQLKIYEERLDSSSKKAPNKDDAHVHPAPPMPKIAMPKKIDAPEGMVKCPKCNGKGCAVVNIGGAQLNLVQEKCEGCDGRGYVTVKTEEGK